MTLNFLSDRAVKHCPLGRCFTAQIKIENYSKFEYNQFVLTEICLGFLNDDIFRVGHTRRACEVNIVRCQQQEPTESSPRKGELVGIPVL